MNKFLNLSIYLFCSILIILAVFYDLQFSLLIYNGESFFGTFFEYVGEFPIYILVSYCMVIFFQRNRQYKSTLQLLINVCFLALAYMFLFLLFFKLYDGSFYIILDSLLALFLLAIFVLSTSFISEKKLQTLYSFCKKTILFITIIFLLNRVIKLLWGRIRFEDLVLLEDFSKFMPFWEISPFSGNKSFCSGHVTSACCLLPLLILVKNSSCKAVYKCICSLSIFAFIFLVAFSRIVYGAHFISDVTFAFLIAWICFSFIFKKDKNK